MNTTRLSVIIPGASSDIIVSAARLAESFNLDLWVGDSHAADRAGNADDSYVMAAAAAVAAVTTHIRIGVFLTLSGSGEPLRLAEDIGVVDQASRGRLELGLVPPDDDNELAAWEQHARSMLTAWHHWPLDEGRSVATTPAPAQPWVSRLVAGPPALADRLRGGIVVFDEDAAAGAAGGTADSDSLPRRTVLALTPDSAEGGIRGWLAPDPVAAVTRLRAAADRAGAHEVMVGITPAGEARLVDDLEALGIVVGTGLRCSPHHLPFLVPDAWRWLTDLRHLHHSPEL